MTVCYLNLNDKCTYFVKVFMAATGLIVKEAALFRDLLKLLAYLKLPIFK